MGNKKSGERRKAAQEMYNIEAIMALRTWYSVLRQITFANSNRSVKTAHINKSVKADLVTFNKIKDRLITSDIQN